MNPINAFGTQQNQNQVQNGVVPVVSPPNMTTTSVAPNSTQISGIGLTTPEVPAAGSVAPAQAAAANTGVASAGTGLFDSIGGWGGIGKGIQNFGNLYMAYQQNKLAKEQQALNKRTFETNLEANRTSYNSSVEDQARNKFVAEGASNVDERVSEYTKDRLI